MQLWAMFRPSARSITITAISAAAVAAAGLFVWLAAPGVMRGLSRGLFQTGGLIFVESPEVYTRQRLVNDRYEQDAWLRGKLEEIDDAVLVERSERRALSAAIAFGTSPAAMPSAEFSGGRADGPGGLPFGPKFDMQSSLRDKIRQRILENSLDDRHDLAGNTVFGLKFDTAVLPGRNTWKTPTVVVKIADTDVDLLRGRTAEVATLYTRTKESDFGRFAAGAGQKEVLGVNHHFDRWRRNLEGRLNAYDVLQDQACSRPDPQEDPGKTPHGPEARASRVERMAGDLKAWNLCGAEGLPACPVADGPASYARWLGTVPLCSVVGSGQSAFDVRVSKYVVDQLLPAMLPEPGRLKAAVESELRVPHSRADYGNTLLRHMQDDAKEICSSFNTALKPEFFNDWSKRHYFFPTSSTTSNEDGYFQDDFPAGELRDPETAAFVNDKPRNVGSFVQWHASSQQAKAPPPARLPFPWGNLFGISLQLRPQPDPMCLGLPVDIRLQEQEVGVMIVEGGDGARFGQVMQSAGWDVISCASASCGPDGGVSVFISRDDGIGDTLRENPFDAATLETLIRDTRPDVPFRGATGWEAIFRALGLAPEEGICPGRSPGLEQQFARARFDAGSPVRAAPWWHYGDTGIPEGERPYFSQFACVRGWVVQMRLGAYRFLQRVAANESYTYAAFPRGDVTGVVSETETRGDLGLSLPVGGTAGLPLGGSVAAEAASRAVEARPGIVNFATGGGGNKAFDFGWAIVKDGRKKPMLASQVVLLSVPAYLEEIELHLWRGFTDIDDRPDIDILSDRDDPGTLFRSGPVSFEEDNPPVVMRLRVPADYSALDGIIVGNELLSGPRIKRTDMDIGGDAVKEADEEKCRSVSEDGDFSVAVIGDRLWRSTVVTLDGLKADRIEVMPDMHGILAVFSAQRSADGKRFVNPVYLAAMNDLEATRSLTVWTSEGKDHVDITLCPAGGAQGDN